MPRILCVYLPMWSTDLVERRRASRNGGSADLRVGKPLVLVVSKGGQQLVARCDPGAVRCGVRPGMSVAHARAMAPGCRVEVFEPAREKAAIRALARWAGRFSPIVGIDTSAVEMGNMIEATPDGLTLDITGCGRLFRGERRLAALVESSIRKLGFRCRVGLGPTIGAAWAIARFKGLAPGVGREVLQSDQGAVGQADLSFAPPGRGESGGKETVPVQSHRHATQMHDALADLPIGALRLTVPTLEALSELGIETIGQILALPKNALPSRFGPLITTRLDQLMGRIHEAIDPVRTVVPLRVERLFDGPSTLREGVELAVRGLLTDLCERLERKEAGVVRLVAEFTRVGEDGRGTQILTEQAALSRPSRDPRHLWSLLYPKVERLHMGFGIEGVALIAGAERRLRRHQGQLGGHLRRSEDQESTRALGELIDGYVNRYGGKSALRIQRVESHIPERSARLRPIESLDVLLKQEPTGGSSPDRPTVLLENPEVVDVISLMPDHPPSVVRWRGTERHIVAGFGPERIAAEWWRGTLAPARAVDGSQGNDARDYYRVQDSTGLWTWVFRQTATSRWYIHGYWA